MSEMSIIFILELNDSVTQSVENDINNESS